MSQSTVTYGNFIISVDIEKTKEYYKNFSQLNNQGNRNFNKYCDCMSDEEKTFFDSLGISPACCNIEHIGVSKKGDFPCGGYYIFCGEYLDYPPEEVITADELAENDFEDDRTDTRINIGIFQFEFQVPEYEFNDVPKDIPEGFVCIKFRCENMKWLLNEKPQEVMYEPPKFWEIHKKIKEICEVKKEQKERTLEQKNEWSAFFKKLKISYTELSSKELKNHRALWINKFSPQSAKPKEIHKLCVKNKNFKPYLWHLFSFEYVSAKTGSDAPKAYNAQNKSECIIVDNIYNLAYIILDADKLDASVVDELIDVTITSSDFKWTYSKTHEAHIGSFFYSK